MHFEFVIGYIMMGIIIALLAGAIVLLLKIKKGLQNGVPARKQQSPVSTYDTPPRDNTTIVLCKKCGTHYPAAQRVCPKCGTVCH